MSINICSILPWLDGQRRVEYIEDGIEKVLYVGIGSDLYTTCAIYEGCILCQRESISPHCENEKVCFYEEIEAQLKEEIIKMCLP